ncbi:unnamed protein product [Prunus armeniaca]|uniref:Uncharacterized protein n=1 Tax=Prunus armeniaca TaxID=36596 RepID=A0A6J5X3S8_PRUAR|nr:unnamed protein product [Prunus armeniaca]
MRVVAKFLEWQLIHQLWRRRPTVMGLHGCHENTRMELSRYRRGFDSSKFGGAYTAPLSGFGDFAGD